MNQVDGWWIPETIVEGKHPIIRRRKGSLIIERTLRYLEEDRRSLAIQAGGHLGLWPKKLSGYFDMVFTFEIDPENYACLCRNVTERNVLIRYGALGDREGTASVKRGPTTGSHYIKESPSGSCPMFRIDDLSTDRVDAIFLDVEGYEVYALRGAIETLNRDKPIVICEENKCCTRYGFEHGDIAAYLSNIGYSEVHRYKKDIVFQVA